MAGARSRLRLLAQERGRYGWLSTQASSAYGRGVRQLSPKGCLLIPTPPRDRATGRLISPGGFEPAFREMRALGKALDPAAITAIAGRYGVEVEFEATGPIMQRHHLVF